MNTELLDYCLYDTCKKVYRILGRGHRERTYQNALEIELLAKNFNVIKEYPLRIVYEGHTINGYFIDIVINNDLPLELKASKNMGISEELQIKNYMIQLKSNTGYLINFGVLELEIIKYSNEEKTDIMEKFRIKVETKKNKKMKIKNIKK